MEIGHLGHSCLRLLCEVIGAEWYTHEHRWVKSARSSFIGSFLE
jgi:hypothetical protein